MVLSYGKSPLTVGRSYCDVLCLYYVLVLMYYVLLTDVLIYDTQKCYKKQVIDK